MMKVVKTNSGRTYDVKEKWFEKHKGKIWVTLDDWKATVAKKKAEKKDEPMADNPVMASENKQTENKERNKK